MGGKVSYHVVGSNNLEPAKKFYDALLATIGMKGVMEHPSGGRVYAGRGTGMFAVLGPYDKNAATIGNGTMGGFSFETKEEAAAFHAKALELGGANEGDPGDRFPGSYFSYFRDLDGNKLAAYKLG